MEKQILQRLYNAERRIADLYKKIKKFIFDAPLDGNLYGRQDGEWVILKEEPIPDDFYIATLIDSSSLLYNSNNEFKYIDLQLYTNITILNTNEIVRNGNDIFLTGNFTFDNTGEPFIARLSGCYLDSNGDFNFIESSFERISTAVHSLLFHNGFLFLTSRTTQTIVLKINTCDFSDIRTLTLPNDATYGGGTTDILGYKDKLYILATTNFNQTSKFIEISDNLIRYRQVFNIPNVAGSYATGDSSPFLIYNDELYITFLVNTTTVAIRVYNLQGNVIRERTNIVINSNVSGSTVAIPHWMGIFNNKLLITYTYGKSLLRLDCATLATEESIALTTSITDDNTIDDKGYIFLNGEVNPWDVTALPQLLKVKYNDFTDYEVLLDGNDFNNGKGSYGSINPSLNKEGLNLFSKKNNILSKTSVYTVVMSDFVNNNRLIIYANATTASFIITLPLAASLSGYEIQVIKTDTTANIVTVKGNGTQLINSANTFVLSTQFSNVTIQSNGTQNYII